MRKDVFLCGFSRLLKLHGFETRFWSQNMLAVVVPDLMVSAVDSDGYVKIVQVRSSISFQILPRSPSDLLLKLVRQNVFTIKSVDVKDIFKLKFQNHVANSQ